VSGRNEQGRPLKLYTTNSAVPVNILEHLLPAQSGQDFTVAYPLIGWPVEPDYNDTLTVENRSFNGTFETKNSLDAIAFYPAPLTYLASLRLSNATAQPSHKPTNDQYRAPTT
jgi:hypothetical protein